MTKKTQECQWRSQMQALLDGRASDEEIRLFNEHLKDCPACSGEWDTWQALRRDLRQTAPAAWNPAPLKRRVFGEAVRPRRVFWVPALVGTALAALLLLLALWPASRPVPVESAPAHESPAVRPPATPESVWVTWLSGAEESGLSSDGQRLFMPDGQGRMSLASGGESALRLGRSISLSAFSESAFALAQSEDGWTVKLERGRVLARLEKQRHRSFSVQVPAGRITAVGTVFSVVRHGDGARVHLNEGRLELQSACGRRYELAAPVAATLRACSLEGLSPLEPEALSWLHRAGQMDAFERGDLAWVRLDSQPGGAQVLAENRNLGVTPLWVARPAGAWDVEVKKEGYRSHTAQLEFSPGRLQRTRLELRKLPPVVGEPARDLLGEARSLLARRRIAEAQALLKRYLDREPGDWQARMLEADCARLDGDARGAIALYLRIGRADKTPTRIHEAAWFEIGRLQLRELNQPQAALRTFKNLRRAHPKGLLRQELAFGLAESYLALKEYSRAVRALEDYLRIFPDGTRARQARDLLKELEEKGWR